MICEDNDWNFFDIDAGGIDELSGGALRDTTNHKSNKTVHSNSSNNSGPAPEGANIGFSDGHLEWRRFNDMEFQVDVGMRFWWQ